MSKAEFKIDVCIFTLFSILPSSWPVFAFNIKYQTTEQQKDCNFIRFFYT